MLQNLPQGMVYSAIWQFITTVAGKQAGKALVAVEVKLEVVKAGSAAFSRQNTIRHARQATRQPKNRVACCYSGTPGGRWCSSAERTVRKVQKQEIKEGAVVEGNM